MKKVIIIGASSGIGAALAELYIKQGYMVGITGRRTKKLNEIKEQLGVHIHTKVMDITNFKAAETKLQELIEVMGGLDIIILSAGIGHHNRYLKFDLEQETINTNVTGFINLANCAYDYFSDKDHGHIVGISSIAALFGNSGAPAYNASKAFISNYMEGLRNKAIKDNHNIKVTDIRPGYVDTDMAQGDNLFWVAPVSVAAQQIFDAIKKKKNIAYVTRRWVIIALIFKAFPSWLRKKI